ncbi:hypothetical protein HPB50_003646 [Hyalomma asiaticum]|uniref:Uncharacterized protein n=1 Tax=Hyalomma asiaticum TaxID=266040 RepID=A0ACB7SAP8_HYAAI|nr:hypothetical protein HPB50_003646 [Hyalomma asiaticum]
MNRAARSFLCVLMPVAALGSSQSPVVSSCLRADGNTYPARFSAVRVSNVSYGQEMTMTFTMATDEELGDQPTLTIDILKPYAYDMSCRKNFGSCEFPMCGLPEDEQSNRLMDPLHSECPVLPGKYVITIAATVPNEAEFVKRIKVHMHRTGPGRGCNIDQPPNITMLALQTPSHSQSSTEA